jgi:hypothetical protein
MASGHKTMYMHMFMHRLYRTCILLRCLACASRTHGQSFRHLCLAIHLAPEDSKFDIDANSPLFIASMMLRPRLATA